MALKSYRRLATNSRFLKGIGIESRLSDVLREDRLEAENQAAVEIDLTLATTFSEADPPAAIRLVADLLGSAIVLEYVALDKNFGEDGELARKPKYLRDKAEKILADLRAHVIGIPGSALYPVPDILPTVAAGEAKPITIHPGLAWGQMAQPRMTDEEKNAIDPERGRRAYDEEASLAGAYGL
jgi:hypothetical protein